MIFCKQKNYQPGQSGCSWWPVLVWADQSPAAVAEVPAVQPEPAPGWLCNLSADYCLQLYLQPERKSSCKA